MRIAFFIGILGAENDAVYAALRKNQSKFSAQGIHIPDASAYRAKLRELVEQRPPRAQAQEAVEGLIASMLGGRQDVETLVLAMPNFLGTAHQTFNGVVLPDGAPRLGYWANIFSDYELDVFMTVANPAVFVPQIMMMAKARSYSFFLKSVEPSDIPWTEAVERLHRPVPEVKFTLWSNEDSLFIWGDILRRILGVGDDAQIIGDVDILMPVLNAEGQGRLQNDPRLGEKLEHVARAALVQEYLDGYAAIEQIDVDIPLENWDQGFVDRVTSNYEADLKRLATLEGIDFIRP